MRDRSHPAYFFRIWTECAWLFRSLTENLDQCVFVLDRAGRCLAANDRFCRWLKRPHQEVVGRHLGAFWPYPLPRQESAVHEHILRGEWIEAEEEGPVGRQTSLVRIRKAPLRDAEGIVCGVLCLFREVPVEPPVEPAAAQTSRMEIVGRLTKSILQDLDNLLASLAAPLARLESSVPPQVAEPELATLHNAVTQAGTLINRLLRLTNGASSAARPTDVHAEPAALPSCAQMFEKTILVVEPDPSVAMLATTILSHWGFRVLASEEGVRASAIYRDQQGQIDLLLVEEDLPGQSGLELANDLLALTPHLAIVLVNAAGDPASSWRTASSRLSFLSKPYTPEQLVQSVRNALSTPR
jgi:PAS domain S-box-containing protein